jgi:hypothetical protein
MNSIGDFAEQLILNQTKSIKEGKELPPQAKAEGLAPAGKDISNVDVPDSFMRSILGESFHPQDAPPAEAIPELVWSDSEPEQATQSLTEETAQELIPLLEEVRFLLKEMSSAMTTTGQIGTNMAGPQKDSGCITKDEKKYGYISARPATSRRDILKQSIRSKLRKK